MFPRSTSRSTKMLLIIVSLLLMALAAMLLVGCPGTSRASNQTVATPPAQLLDSSSLINRLAYLTTKEMAGRESATPGGLLAQQYVLRQFDSLQIAKAGDSYLQPFKLRGRDSTRMGHNIVGIIKGTRYPDSYIAVTAHYDHVGTKSGEIYYGADDNASGTANLLTMAQYFKKHPPQHSLLIVAFDAEEKGLLGSRYFVDHLPVPQSSIIMNLNMDMISRNDSNEIYASGIHHYPFLQKYIDSAQALTTVNIRFGHDDPSKGGSQDWTTQSDHYAFHLKKIPFIYFGVEDHADYHKPTDSFDKIDKHFYYQVCTMIANTLLLLDRQEKIQ